VVKLIFEESVLNVVSAYTQQIGYEEEDNCFGDKWMR